MRHLCQAGESVGHRGAGAGALLARGIAQRDDSFDAAHRRSGGGCSGGGVQSLSAVVFATVGASPPSSVIGGG